jgi:hypothetical protein
VAEYEALVLGLDTARKMDIILSKIFGNFNLIMNQVKEVCQTMHPRLRQYKHEVRNMFDNFFDVVNIIVVPREVNHRANNLSKSVVYLMPPNLDHFLYSIKVMH